MPQQGLGVSGARAAD